MVFYGLFGPLKGPQRVERPGNIKQTALTNVVYIHANTMFFFNSFISNQNYSDSIS
jgi:hypothetical protein